ncbi:winged helix-turn-helix domain-containing protein [Streptomyces sp. NPDC093260]|uniref:winged helix-turn-helix domain-containing protein n=1 Tax=Streptomyces sp. NPDC093260 TaxID=3155073 RepID=UPI0034124D2C
MNAGGLPPAEAVDAQRLFRLRDEVLAATAVDQVHVARLVVGDSPRLAGEDPAHVRILAEVEDSLPPLVVHRPTMRVIDGIARLRAAAHRRRTTVAVRFFDGTAQEADLLAVALNITHGRPLTLEDRIAAALRIFVSHPRWSDRAVAALAGLSATKVAALRRDGAGARGGRRVGKDGRVRPVDAAAGRERARLLLERDPGASMRQIAREAGISAATVADVRDRMRRGESVVPAGCSGAVRERTAAARRIVSVVPARPAREADELARAVHGLQRDPSLRQSEEGRSLLRMLSVCGVFARDRDTIAAALPRHCRPRLAELLLDCAQICQDVAGDLTGTPGTARLHAVGS